VRRSRRLAAAAWLLLAVLGFPFAASGQPASAPPEEVKLGLYLTGLSSFNLGAGTFVADFWLWSTTRSEKLTPLDTMDIVNAASRQGELLGTRRIDGMRWDQQRVRLTARTDFQIHHFPFDRQKLHLIFEDSFLTAKEMVLVADRENSRVSRALHIPGWKILGWEIGVTEHQYLSNFGDPTQSGPTPASRLVFTVDIERQGRAEFIELTLGAFVAFAILALSFRMNPTLPPIFAGRMGVIVASVFTVVISLRSANTVTLLPLGATLADRIHFLTLAAGFAAAVAAAAVRYVAESGREATALTIDRRIMPIFIAIYGVIVTIMIAAALLQE